MESTLIVTAISELARNLVLYPKRGVITMTTIRHEGRLGISIQADDQGSGIENVERAVQDGYSTSGRLGVGLPGTKRIMDEFEIRSQVGQGTTVTATKWRRLIGKKPD